MWCFFCRVEFFCSATKGLGVSERSTSRSTGNEFAKSNWEIIEEREIIYLYHNTCFNKYSSLQFSRHVEKKTIYKTLRTRFWHFPVSRLFITRVCTKWLGQGNWDKITRFSFCGKVDHPYHPFPPFARPGAKPNRTGCNGAAGSATGAAPVDTRWPRTAPGWRTESKRPRSWWSRARKRRSTKASSWWRFRWVLRAVWRRLRFVHRVWVKKFGV